MTRWMEKAERFRALHQGQEPFVMPNPWDAGSARLLAGLGFPALATTSSGFALSLGRLDGSVSLDEKLAHCRALVDATDLPLSADLENGYADSPEEVANTIRAVAETGVAGGSIEDHTRDPKRPIYDFDLAVERVHAAAEAAHALDRPFTLTARAENHLWGSTDLDDTIRRLKAFEAAGADVLYAPGLTSLDAVRQVVASVDRPVNVLAPPLRDVSVEQLAAAGVIRISVGGALAQAAMGTLVTAGRAMRERGRFDRAGPGVSGSGLARLLGPWTG